LRILIWVGLIFLVILAIRKNIRTTINKAHKRHRNPDAQMNESSIAPEKPMEAMVCCATCQVYIPASEAIIKNDATYCSVEHSQTQ
jgi:uncharacterized protein